MCAWYLCNVSLRKLQISHALIYSLSSAFLSFFFFLPLHSPQLRGPGLKPWTWQQGGPWPLGQPQWFLFIRLFVGSSEEDGTGGCLPHSRSCCLMTMKHVIFRPTSTVWSHLSIFWVESNDEPNATKFFSSVLFYYWVKNCKRKLKWWMYRSSICSLVRMGLILTAGKSIQQNGRLCRSYSDNTRMKLS